MKCIRHGVLKYWVIADFAKEKVMRYLGFAPRTLFYTNLINTAKT